MKMKLKEKIEITFNNNTYYYLNNILLDLLKKNMNNKRLIEYYKQKNEIEFKINFILNNEKENYYNLKNEMYKDLIENYILILENENEYNELYEMYLKLTNINLVFYYKPYNMKKDKNIFNELKNNFHYDNIYKFIGENLKHMKKDNAHNLYKSIKAYDYINSIEKNNVLECLKMIKFILNNI